MSIDARITKIALQRQLEFADVEFGTTHHRHAATFTNPSMTTECSQPSEERRYLVASITKPIVAMAILKLAAEGELSLSERIGHYVDKFGKANYRRITVRHLLTHTSGFSDMVPNNLELRKSHASLSEFLDEASSHDTEFLAGSDSRYSSIGFLILGEMISRITSMSTADFLNRVFFQPMQMTGSSLGPVTDGVDSACRTALPCQLPIWQPDSEAEWGWNSEYWRNLGAPWGGMISSAPDLGKFARMMLNHGKNDSGQQILPPSVVKQAMTNQLRHYCDETAFVGSHRGWGLGWRMQWPAHPASFGDFVSPLTTGHWGATGTLMWIDPAAQKYAVMLTTTPYENSRTAIQQISNIASTNPLAG